MSHTTTATRTISNGMSNGGFTSTILEVISYGSPTGRPEHRMVAALIREPNGTERIAKLDQNMTIITTN